MDSDDAITPTALEELYPLAKKFNADIVHCEKFEKMFSQTLEQSMDMRNDNHCS